MEIIELETEVVDVIERTHDVKSIRLKVDYKKGFMPGQWFFVTLDKDREIQRHLTISNSPTETGFIEFTKKLTGSDFSKILETIKPGDWAKIRYPFGEFIFEGEYKKIAFLSGGIGITPIRSITKYVVDKKLDIDMILLYGNRTEKDIAFKEDFDKMQQQYAKLKIVHVLSEQKENWDGRRGFINSQVIKEEIPDYRERKFYISGPPAMVEAMKKTLTDDLNLSNEDIFTENFTGY